MYKTLNFCRLCNGDFFNSTLKLRETPIANELYFNAESAKRAEKFPLEVAMCKDCRHVQLKHIVSSNRLFDDYVYKSGTSSFFNQHFENLACQIKNDYQIGSYVLEIGSNDGVLLKSFEAKGVKAIGIEPSTFLANECKLAGLDVINSYLNPDVISRIIEQNGEASLVVGNNVFAHIEDLQDAFTNVNRVLGKNGTFIFEVAHFKYILTSGIFDTIYHEHMSYHTVYSIEKFAIKSGFKLIKVESIESHGGSLRFFLSKNLDHIVDSSVKNLIEEENALGLTSVDVFEKIENIINKVKENVSEFILDLESVSNTVIFGYGAPAKVITFIYQMELEYLNLLGVIDDNPDKQNKFLPGCGFSINSTETMKKLLITSELEESNLLCLVFPWNIYQEIIDKLRLWLPKRSRIVAFLPKVNEVKL